MPPGGESLLFFILSVVLCQTVKVGRPQKKNEFGQQKEWAGLSQLNSDPDSTKLEKGGMWGAIGPLSLALYAAAPVHLSSVHLSSVHLSSVHLSSCPLSTCPPL
ncbi:unnamed protein product [Lota lota]